MFCKTLPCTDVAAARLYICGLGLYEAMLNGEKIGDEYLTPYCSNYDAWLHTRPTPSPPSCKKAVTCV